MNKVKLGPGEYYCKYCKGTGEEPAPQHMNYQTYVWECDHCNGTGKIDWIENVVGVNREYTEEDMKKNDIYSLGVIIFEMFYNFSTIMEKYKTLKEINNNILHKFFPNDEHLKKIIYNCITSNVKERYNIKQLLININNYDIINQIP